MSGHTSGLETSDARAVSSEIRSILNDLDSSEFVNAQERLSRRLDRIHSELGKIETRAWLGSEPRLHVEKMLEGIIGEALETYMKSIHDTLHEICASILENSREIQKMNASITNLTSRQPGENKEWKDMLQEKKEHALATLSNREKEVVENLLLGMTNREIADRLEISERTVKNHLWKIYNKLAVDNRSQLFNMLSNL